MHHREDDLPRQAEGTLAEQGRRQRPATTLHKAGERVNTEEPERRGHSPNAWSLRSVCRRTEAASPRG